MSGVYGIRQDELARLCERAPVFYDIKIIDPIYLFRSKCHCLLGLDQSDRQDERHVRMLALILPEYLSSSSMCETVVATLILQRSKIHYRQLKFINTTLSFKLRCWTSDVPI